VARGREPDHGLHGVRAAPALGAGAGPGVADGVIGGAAGGAVLAAGGAFGGAAAPDEAHVPDAVRAAAGAPRRARAVAVAGHRRRRRGGRVRVRPTLHGVGRLHGDAALAGARAHVALHPDVAALAPVGAPRVAHQPVVPPAVRLRAVPHRHHAVVERCAAPAGEHALPWPWLLHVGRWSVFIWKKKKDETLTYQRHSSS